MNLPKMKLPSPKPAMNEARMVLTAKLVLPNTSVSMRVQVIS